MSVKPDLRLNLSKIKPEIRGIVSNKATPTISLHKFFKYCVIIALYIYHLIVQNGKTN
jgi:hypothetical protein